MIDASWRPFEYNSPKKFCVSRLIISISLAPVIFDTISKWAFVREDDNIQESRALFCDRRRPVVECLRGREEQVILRYVLFFNYDLGHVYIGWFDLAFLVALLRW